MVVFLPIGVEGATVDRLPWISIGIAALCAAAFAVTWVLPAEPDAGGMELHEVLLYWSQHPHLELPPSVRGMLPRSTRERLETGLFEGAETPEATAGELAEFDRLVTRYEEAFDSSLLRRYAFVAARGPRQIGWLTGLFLHWGWMHLLGNLLFFYIVGPLLEDLWGRPLFAGFYLVAGLVATGAQGALDPASSVSVVGASGAIAGCMGAFTVRCASRRIRMGYFVWLWIRIWRGVFLLPAWLWGVLWFASELFSYWMTGGESGVAVMAHIGGFAFGFAIAAALAATGVEKRFISSTLQAKVGWSRPAGLDEVDAALAAKDWEGAERGYRKVLEGSPTDVEAALGLAELERKRGRDAAATARIERLLVSLLSGGQHPRLWEALERLGPDLRPEEIRPPAAYRLAVALEKAPEALRALRAPLFEVAGGAPGALGAKALARAAELALDGWSGAEKALGLVRRAREVPGLSADQLQQLAAIAARANARQTSTQGGSGLELDLEESPQPPVRPAPTVRRCRLVSLHEGNIVVEAQGRQKTLALRQIAAVGVGIVPQAATSPGANRRELLTDLVVSWGGAGGGPMVLRLPAEDLGLVRHFPSVPPAQAYPQLLGFLLRGSGATAMPGVQALAAGQYPQFADVAALEAAFYGGATRT